MNNGKNYIASFDEYLRQGEPSKQESAANWQTAIGLQAVDGLQPSAYLLEVAGRNIEGEITLEESRQLIDSYYQSKTARTPKEEEEEEADKVSANIARILKSHTFAFNTNGYISLHRRIFEGVFKHAGEIRTYDIAKREWVLEGDTVNYLNWEDLRRALDWDIEQEKKFSYRGLSEEEKIEHIANFISGIWQIHAFREGNTRTTAVFAIQYLRSLGFHVDNRMFALHSWYFRNALVRANYRNVQKDIDYTPLYLVRFFRNLLLGEKWDLKNRYLHIHATKEWGSQPCLEIGSSDENSRSSNGKSASKVEKSRSKTEILLEYCQEPRSLSQIAQFLGMKDKYYMKKKYIDPLLGKSLRMTEPASPNSPTQKYVAIGWSGW